MGCCNKKRTSNLAREARSVPSPARRPPDVRVRGESPVQSDVLVRFVGAGRIRVEGSVSGRVYRPSPSDRLVRADPLDLRGLLRTRLFVEDGGR
jgi:hypothetical protein